jgi:hypothetical protein
MHSNLEQKVSQMVVRRWLVCVAHLFPACVYRRSERATRCRDTGTGVTDPKSLNT